MKLEYNSHRAICQYKASSIAKGFEQKEDIDFKETFSSVVKSYAIWILLALAAFYSWNVKQIIAIAAYLNFAIYVTLYIEISAG